MPLPARARSGNADSVATLSRGWSLFGRADAALPGHRYRLRGGGNTVTADSVQGQFPRGAGILACRWLFARNPKSEYRNPKQTQNPNSQTHAPEGLVLEFGFRVSDLFRISCFGF